MWKDSPQDLGNGSLGKVPALKAWGAEFHPTETMYATAINENGGHECEREQGRANGNIWRESREGGDGIIYYDLKE